jgi:hypothetical protein
VRSIDEILDIEEDELGWVEDGCSKTPVYTEWKYSLNIDAILCGVDACYLLSGLFVQMYKWLNWVHFQNST